jgi:hypothetical protein
MQVICPHCKELGYLQKVTTRFYRVRHYVCKHPTKVYKGGDKASVYRYCNVTLEWALKQIATGDNILNWFLEK